MKESEPSVLGFYHLVNQWGLTYGKWTGVSQTGLIAKTAKKSAVGKHHHLFLLLWHNSKYQVAMFVLFKVSYPAGASACFLMGTRSGSSGNCMRRKWKFYPLSTPMEASSPECRCAERLRCILSRAFPVHWPLSQFCNNVGTHSPKYCVNRNVKYTTCMCKYMQNHSVS